ncbi:SseB family protein [Aliiroseovarius sp. YM-037]|uniref:SseB family protein n=1 Tax=Aliiroseovarius sp. YM-037 TaxID=3341728 RepID=UPI003A80C17E
MTDITPIDKSHQAMEAAPEDVSARLRFYERVAESELFLLLQEEPQGDQMTPQMFDVETGQFVLVFDREERLADFVGGTAPYAVLSGRVISEMLAGQGVGLGLNLSVAPSSFLIPADGVDWLAETLSNKPQQVDATPEEVSAPHGVPEALLTALDAKLALAAGLALSAYLVSVQFKDRGQGHLLAFVDAVPGAEDALASAVAEALTFSGVEAGALDVAFFKASDPMAARLARVGLQFDLPELEASDHTPAAPGRNPDKPPILR